MLCVDIDGVVADTELLFRNEIEKKLGRPLSLGKIRKYDFDGDFDLNILGEIFNEVIINQADKIPVYNYSDTIFALKIIQVNYDEVVFLTARRGHNVKKATINWLKNKFSHNLRFRVKFIGDGSKKRWMKENGFKSIVEDRFKTVNDINFNEGHTFLVNRPWNMGRSEKPHVTRVKDLLEAVLIYGKFI